MKKINGTIVLKILTAELLQEKEYIFGKIDPFCRISVNEEYIETTEKVNAGKKPSWDEVFTFYCKLGDELKYKVFDRDPNIIGESIIGEGTVTIGDNFVNNTSSLWFPLHLSGVSAGELAMELCFYPDNEACLKAIDEMQSRLAIIVKERDTLRDVLKRLTTGEIKPAEVNESESQEEPSLDFMRIENESLRTSIEQLQSKADKMEENLLKMRAELKKTKDASEMCFDINNKYRKEVSTLRKLDLPGLIRIQDLRLSLLEDSDSIGSMDPYICIQCGPNSKTTTVKQDGGTSVAWNEIFEFQRSSGEEVIKFIVSDKETFGGSELIAVGCLGINPMVINKIKKEAKVVLTMGQQTVGTLLLNAEFIAT